MISYKTETGLGYPKQTNKKQETTETVSLVTDYQEAGDHLPTCRVNSLELVFFEFGLSVWVNGERGQWWVGLVQFHTLLDVAFCYTCWSLTSWLPVHS